MPDQKLSEVKEVLKKHLAEWRTLPKSYAQERGEPDFVLQALSFALDIIEKWEKLQTEETIKNMWIKSSLPATTGYSPEIKKVLEEYRGKILKNLGIKEGGESGNKL